MNIAIRPMTNFDVPVCCNIVQQNWNDDVAIRFADEIQRCWSGTDDAPIYYVALVNGKIAGFAGMQASYLMFGFWEFIWINVEKSHQGVGVGKELTRYRIDEVKRQGGRVILAVTKQVRFFRSFGFSVDRAFDDYWNLMSYQLGQVAL